MRNRIIFILLALFLIYTIGIAPNGIPISRDGIRTGTVYKISRKGPFYTFGLMCWTWEGEMSLHMPDTMVGKEGSVFNFSVSDPSIVEEIQKASRDGQLVTLKYTELALRLSCFGETSYNVTGVE
jgi:hypothetical protein